MQRASFIMWATKCFGALEEEDFQDLCQRIVAVHEETAGATVEITPTVANEHQQEFEELQSEDMNDAGSSLCRRQRQTRNLFKVLDANKNGTLS